jgi:hypothetical protein
LLYVVQEGFHAKGGCDREAEVVVEDLDVEGLDVVDLVSVALDSADLEA